MQLGEISFCDKIGYNIKDDGFKRKILDDVFQKFGCKIIQKHHENFDIDSPLTLKRVTSVPHMVSTKTNGNPYFLYLMRHNNANQCIFIDKKIQQGYFTPRMIVVKLWFEDALFKNTLFEGEMVKDKNDSWYFIINDLIAHENINLSPQKLIPRINILYKTLQNQYFDDDTACCRLCVKKYFKYEDIPYIVKVFIPSLPYTCRGLYFKPIYSNFRDVLYNFDGSLIKNVQRHKYADITNKSFFSHKDEIKSPAPFLAVPAAELKEVKEKDKEKEKDKDKETKDKKENKIQKIAVFMVNKTNAPDVYEMVGIPGHPLNNTEPDPNTTEIACVQSQKTSRMMRELFGTRTFLQKVAMAATFNERFEKWVPLHFV